MNCCVIQIARTGDLAQSVPLLRALKSAGRSISLVCSQDPGEWIRIWCDTVIVVDTRELLHLQNNCMAQLAGLRNSLSELLVPDYEECYNLNDAPPARAIMQMVNAKRVFGFATEETRASAWMRALGTQRRDNSVHLSEWQLTLNPELSAEVSAAQVQNTGPLVIHCGSGSSIRQLSEHFWMQLIQEILVLNSSQEILLSGSSEEVQLCELLASTSSQVQSIAGKTDLDQLLSIIEGAKGFLSQDTGILHMGALTSVPVLGLYYGSARAIETGPFQHAAMVMEIQADCYPCLESNPTCGTHECRSWLKPVDCARQFHALLTGAGILPSTNTRVRTLQADMESGNYLLRDAAGVASCRENEKNAQLDFLRGDASESQAVDYKLSPEMAQQRKMSHADYMNRCAQTYPKGIAELAEHWLAASKLGTGETSKGLDA